MSPPPLFGDYYLLSKPGIVYSNALAAAAGFFLASRWHPDLARLLFALAGIALVIAGACAINNVIDRDIDAKMTRTRARPVVRGAIGTRAALSYGIVLAVAGLAILGVFTTLAAAAAAAAGLFVYVVAYSLWGKRHTVHGTAIGAISGAMPPLVGYAAASGRLDAAALMLFAALFFWQMPHFFAIAIFREDEYAKAGIPTVPSRRGLLNAKFQMLFYVAAFLAAALALAAFGYSGRIYAVVVGAVGAAWVAYAVAGFWAVDDRRFARRMFLFSLVALIVFCAALALDPTVA